VAVFIEVAHHHRNVICQVVVKVSSLNQFWCNSVDQTDSSYSPEVSC
jgi:hypothetical protein